MLCFIFHDTIKCIAYKYLVIVVLVCNAFCVFSQQNISQRISEVFISKNIEECKILITQITESDIANMSDSTLFDYCYIVGWYYYENNDYEKQIDYLVQAKEICETRLGIANNILAYFEIIKALGDACENLNKDDEALLWYEEGLIKGLSYLVTDVEPLKTYLDEIRNNTADIYEEKGHLDIARYIREEKPLDNVGLFDYACELLNNALKLNSEERCHEALELLEEAQHIFERSGNDGKEMLQPLYRIYLNCYAQLGDKKNIDALLRTKSETMFYDGNESYLLSDMSEVITKFILTHYDTQTAEYYYQELLKKIDRTNSEDLMQVEKLGSQIDYFKKVYSQIDSLENEKSILPELNYEWGIVSYQQANLLIQIQRYDDANSICEQIYSMSAKLNEDPQKLHWFVLTNLSDYYTQSRDFHKSERYLNEQLEWMDSNKISLDAEERGWVYNKLGIAYLYGKRYSEGKDMYDKAEKILLPIYGHQSQEYATILHNKGRLAQLEGKLEEAKHYLEEAKQIQIETDGKAMDRTIQYLEEVNHAIDVRL